MNFLHINFSDPFDILGYICSRIFMIIGMITVFKYVFKNKK